MREGTNMMNGFGISSLCLVRSPSEENFISARPLMRIFVVFESRYQTEGKRTPDTGGKGEN